MFSFITAHPTKVEKQNNSLSASSPSQSRSTGPALVFARIECEEHTFTCISVALQHQTSGERAAYRPLGKAGGGGQRIRASALSGECSFLFPFASSFLSLGRVLISMQTTLVTAPGSRNARSKTTLYVGGLADGVSEAVLHAVVLPFGEVKAS